jgi:hypothetical protein
MPKKCEGQVFSFFPKSHQQAKVASLAKKAEVAFKGGRN